MYGLFELKVLADKVIWKYKVSLGDIDKTHAFMVAFCRDFVSATHPLESYRTHGHNICGPDNHLSMPTEFERFRGYLATSCEPVVVCDTTNLRPGCAYPQFYILKDDETVLPLEIHLPDGPLPRNIEWIADYQ